MGKSSVPILLVEPGANLSHDAYRSGPTACGRPCILPYLRPSIVWLPISPPSVA